jgi:hypothetical protein
LKEGGSGVKEYEIACHEAGHAVLQVIVGDGCHHVTVVPKVFPQWGDRKDYGVAGYSQGVVGDDTYINAVVNVGGGAATQVVLGSGSGISGGDKELLHKNAEKLGMRVGSTEYQKFRDDVFAKAVAILSKRVTKAALLEVADALVVNKTLRGSEVKTIINKHRYPGLFQFDAGNQYKFQFRENGIARDYHNGYALSQPKYAQILEKLEKDGTSAKPEPFPCRVPMVGDQMELKFTLSLETGYASW